MKPDIRQPLVATLIWTNSKANKTNHVIHSLDDVPGRQKTMRLIMLRTISLIERGSKNEVQFP